MIYFEKQKDFCLGKGTLQISVSLDLKPEALSQLGLTKSLFLCLKVQIYETKRYIKRQNMAGTREKSRSLSDGREGLR